MRAFDAIFKLLQAALGFCAAGAFAWSLYRQWSGAGPDMAPGLLLLAGLLYLAPTWVAVRRRHRDRMAIGALNLLLGATGLGWIGALVWALTSNVEPRDAPAPSETTAAAEPPQRSTIETTTRDAARSLGANVARSALARLRVED